VISGRIVLVGATGYTAELTARALVEPGDVLISMSDRSLRCGAAPVEAAIDVRASYISPPTAAGQIQPTGHVAAARSPRQSCRERPTSRDLKRQQVGAGRTALGATRATQAGPTDDCWVAKPEAPCGAAGSDRDDRFVANAIVRSGGVA
jgi:hypothetical protein